MRGRVRYHLYVGVATQIWHLARVLKIKKDSERERNQTQYCIICTDYMTLCRCWLLWCFSPVDQQRELNYLTSQRIQFRRKLCASCFPSRRWRPHLTLDINYPSQCYLYVPEPGTSWAFKAGLTSATLSEVSHRPRVMWGPDSPTVSHLTSQGPWSTQVEAKPASTPSAEAAPPVGPHHSDQRECALTFHSPSQDGLHVFFSPFSFKSPAGAF